MHVRKHIVATAVLLSTLALTSMPASAGAVAPAQRLGTLTTALTLILRPGTRKTNGQLQKSAPIPSGMPKFLIPLTVPLYPKAVKSRQPAPPWMSPGGSFSVFVKSAVATYVVAAPMGTVEAWYQHALVGCGLPSSGGGSGSGPGYHYSYISFGSQAIPSLDDSLTGISFARRAGRTMLFYQADASSYPPLLETTYFPYSAKSVWVSFTPCCGGPDKPYQGAVTDPDMIAAIAEAFNQASTVNGPGRALEAALRVAQPAKSYSSSRTATGSPPRSTGPVCVFRSQLTSRA